MEWLNIRVSNLRAPEYIGSDPVERATWLNVLAFCVEQENGGRITGAAAWKDRQWQQSCGVTLKEARENPRLLLWEGADLVVWNYPLEKEAEVISKRAGGAKGVRARWEKARAATNASAGSSPDSSAIPSASNSGNSSGNSSGDNSAYTEEERNRNRNGKENGKPSGEVVSDFQKLQETIAWIVGIFGTKKRLKDQSERELGRQAAFLPLSASDKALLEWYHAQPTDRKGSEIVGRHIDADGLASNLFIALDRAREFAKKTGGGPGFAPEKKETAAPAGWQAWFAGKYQENPCPAAFTDLPDYLQNDAKKELGAAQ